MESMSRMKAPLHLDELPLEVLEGELCPHLDDLSFTLFRLTHSTHIALFPLADPRNLRKDRFIREIIRQGDLNLFLWARTECRCSLNLQAFMEILHCRRNSLDFVEYFAPLIDETMETQAGWNSLNIPMYRGVVALQKKRFLTSYQYACLLALTQSEDAELYSQERLKRHIRPEFFPKIIDPDFSLEEMTDEGSLEFFMFQSMLKSLLPLVPELYPTFYEELKAAVASDPRRRRLDFLLSENDPSTYARFSMLIDLFFVAPVDGVSFVARWAVAKLNLPQLRSIYMNYVMHLLCQLKCPVCVNTFKFLGVVCKASEVTLKSNGLGFEDYDFIRPALRANNLPVLRTIIEEGLVDVEPEIGTHYFGPLAIIHVYKTFQRLQADPKTKSAFDTYLATERRNVKKGDKLYQLASEFGVKIDESFARYLDSKGYTLSPAMPPRDSLELL